MQPAVEADANEHTDPIFTDENWGNIGQGYDTVAKILKPIWQIFDIGSDALVDSLVRSLSPGNLVRSADSHVELALNLRLCSHA